MPKVFEWKGWRFEFYSLDRHEPPHIHTYSQGPEGNKDRLERLEVARNKRCTDRELNELLDVVKHHQHAFLEKWNEHFGN